MIKHAQLQRPFVSSGGHAFNARVPPNIVELAASAIVLVLEDGRALGPGNVQHLQIRKQGKGLFNLSGGDIYFSSSDNTNCSENGRVYTLLAIDFSQEGILYQEVLETLSRHDEDVVRLVARNHGHNNSFFLNFFSYYNVLTNVLARNHISFPKAAIEIGTGTRPYTALRFLLEGVERFIANDLMQIQSSFDQSFISDLRTVVELITPSLGNRLDRITSTRAASSKVEIDGLEIQDQRPFEEIAVTGNFDLIFSTSALEHVMKPHAVIEKMAGLIKPGAHVWHSIDLRDHRDFGNPLAFLELSAEEYRCVNSENRLRASDWLALFQAAGFELLECESGTFADASQTTFKYTLARPEPPFVSENMRRLFKAPFDTKDLSDLSTLGVRILARKIG